MVSRTSNDIANIVLNFLKEKSIPIADCRRPVIRQREQRLENIVVHET